MNPHSWPPKRNVPAPSIDPRWQKELTAIGGISHNGQFPRLRLSWGQEVRMFWEGEMRMRYLYSTRTVNHGWVINYFDETGKLSDVKRLPPSADPPPASLGGIVERNIERYDIGINRWFIEQYFEPEIACVDWEDSRWDWRDGRRVDVTGPEPREGMYADAFYVITEHTQDCCFASDAMGLKCFGEYREPSHIDMAYAMCVMSMARERDKNFSWTEEAPREVILQRLRDRLDEIKADRDKESKELRYRINHVLKTQSKQLGDGHGLDLQKFHFLDKATALPVRPRNSDEPLIVGPNGAPPPASDQPLITLASH